MGLGLGLGLELGLGLGIGLDGVEGALVGELGAHGGDQVDVAVEEQQGADLAGRLAGRQLPLGLEAAPHLLQHREHLARGRARGRARG